jgi:capsular polysaccharide biosynthesis protein
MDPAGAPLARRKTIVFLTRGDGTSTASRAWLNQEESLTATRALLTERGQGEVVEIFSVRALAADPLAALKLFARARAIIGVHGVALYNHIWAAPDTLVLEIWPVTADGSKMRSGNLFWCVIWALTPPNGRMHD